MDGQKGHLKSPHWLEWQHEQSREENCEAIQFPCSYLKHLPKLLALPDRICKEMPDSTLTSSSQLVTSPATLLQRTGNVYPYNYQQSLGALIWSAIVRCFSIIFLNNHHQFQFTLPTNSSKWITVRKGFKVTGIVTSVYFHFPHWHQLKNGEKYHSFFPESLFKLESSLVQPHCIYIYRSLSQ